LENWIELSQRLLATDKSLHLVATGSARPREQERLAELAKAVNQSRLICLTDASIAKLSAILQRCRLQIGADSGVIHLAMALDVSTIGLFRDYSGLKEWLPVGEKHQHFVARCHCMEENRTDCLIFGKAACLGSISAQQVAEAALNHGR
jgi:ADP-heptose:LPS heptosyltransferase